MEELVYLTSMRGVVQVWESFLYMGNNIYKY